MLCNRCGETDSAKFYPYRKFRCKQCVQQVNKKWLALEENRKRKAELKCMARIMALPGYKAAKHDAHVDAYKAFVMSEPKPKPFELHDAHVKEWKRNAAARHRWRLRTDPGFKLNMRLRAQIRKALKGRKAGRSWESFVGYTLADLERHLSLMLPKRVTLEQALADGWHIDHITPKCTFNLADPAELAQAWALPNLRLVPARVNLAKSNRRVFLV